jgi:ubiquinol-cytochrome c reductase cytochrome b subunit
MHVVLLPLIGILVLSIHYYKVAREHGISLPAAYEEGNLPAEKIKEGKQRIDLIPDLLSHEIFLACFVTGLMLLYMVFFYAGAPLETHANPLQTPLDTKAPWYFWWIQGMLKLGDPTWMGVIIPTIMVLLMMATPYIDRNPKRLAKNRPIGIAWGLFWVVFLIITSYMGLPVFGIEPIPAVRVIQDLAPEEGVGLLRAIPYDELVPGVYYTGEVDLETMPKHLAEFFTEYTEKIAGWEERGEFQDSSGLMYISEWQDDVKRVVLEIEWLDPKTLEPKSYTHEYFLHLDRPRDQH